MWPPLCDVTVMIVFITVSVARTAKKKHCNEKSPNENINFSDSAINWLTFPEGIC